MKRANGVKEKAQKLRLRGLTYSEIKQKLNLKIPKSTLSHWCAKIVMPSWYQNKINKLNHLNLNKAQKMAWISNKRKREEFLKNIWDKNIYLLNKLKDKDVLKLLLAVLYLGEGAKWKSRSGMQLGSSELDIIKFYLRLLKRCYGFKPHMLKCRISYRADQNINSLKKYWSRKLSIPLSNFYKTKPDPRTIGKPTKNKQYKGVCVISGGSSNIQLELETIPKIILKGI